MYGATSFCVNSRTVCTSALWSSVSSKSIMQVTLSNKVLKMTGHLTQHQTRMSKRQYPQLPQIRYTSVHAEKKSSGPRDYGRSRANELRSQARDQSQESDCRRQGCSKAWGADHMSSGALSLTILLSN